ncbi:g4808 [Coccomyxa elongata]
MIDKQAETLMQDIMFPRRTYACISKMRAMREDLLDFLYAASRVSGPMKVGQRFWSRFALRHIQSWLCAQEMQEILEVETEDHSVHVERGALLLAQIHYPGEDLSAIGSFLDDLAVELLRRMQAQGITGGVPALELLSHLLFGPEPSGGHKEPEDVATPRRRRSQSDTPPKLDSLKVPEDGHGLGLRGESRDYYRASNSLLPCVLTHKKGIPISLAVVHAAVGRRAGLPIDCIGMPMHLINRMVVPESGEERFIDVFRGGELLTRQQVNSMMIALMDSVAPTFLQPLRRSDLYMRMCVNLCHIYRGGSATHEPEMLRSVLELLLACNEVIDYRRAHAAVCEKMGDYEAVRDDLEMMVPGASTTGQFAMSLVRREQEMASESNRQIRRPKDGSVKYRVGDVMVHTRYGYQGILYGWDATCSAGDEWIAQMHVDSLPGGRDQPFYHVLVDPEDRPMQSTYVAQENIMLVPHQVVRQVYHPEVGRYFDGIQPGKYCYTPNAYLHFRYPDD